MKRFLLSFAVLATLVLFAGSAVAQCPLKPTISRPAVRPALLQGHRFLVVLRRHRGRPGTIVRRRLRPSTLQSLREDPVSFTLRPRVPATASCRSGRQSILALPKSSIQRPIFVVRGKVGMGTGNGGNTGFDTFTTGIDRWETIRGTNTVCPANETIIYSADGPADFYVDSASVDGGFQCSMSPGQAQSDHRKFRVQRAGRSCTR